MLQRLINISAILAFFLGIFSLIQWVAPNELQVYSERTIGPCVLGPDSGARIIQELYDPDTLRTEVYYLQKFGISFENARAAYVNIISNGKIVEKEVLQCTDGPGYMFEEDDGKFLRIVIFEPPINWNGLQLGSDKFIPFREEINDRLGCPPGAYVSGCLEDRNQIIRVPLNILEESRFVDFRRSREELRFSGPVSLTTTGDVDAAIHTFMPVDMAHSSLYSEYHCTLLKLRAPDYLSFIPCKWPVSRILEVSDEN